MDQLGRNAGQQLQQFQRALTQLQRQGLDLGGRIGGLRDRFDPRGEERIPLDS